VTVKPKRKVRIVWTDFARSWSVLYVERRKGTRYGPAGFYGPDHTREWVVNWVKTHGFELVDEPENPVREHSPADIRSRLGIFPNGNIK